MKRAVLACCLLLLACADEAPPPGSDPSLSCERYVSTETSAPGPAVDVVLVVSDAASMAPYRDRLIAALTELGDALEPLAYGPLLHLAVVGDDTGGFTTSPQLDGCAPPDDDYVISLAQPWLECPGVDGCAARNFSGSVADVTSCIGAVTAGGGEQVRLLERAARASEQTAGFARSDAYLFLIVLASTDDASPDGVATYADRLLEDRDPDRAFVSVVAPGDAPRLAELAARFPYALVGEPDDATWSGVARITEVVKDTLDLPGCVQAGELLDVDPDAPGLQTECVGREWDYATGLGAVVPPCEMTTPDRPSPTTPLPCFWIRPPTASEVAAGCEHRAVIERPLWPHSDGVLQCACDPSTEDEAFDL